MLAALHPIRSPSAAPLPKNGRGGPSGRNLPPASPAADSSAGMSLGETAARASQEWSPFTQNHDPSYWRALRGAYGGDVVRMSAAAQLILTRRGNEGRDTIGCGTGCGRSGRGLFWCARRENDVHRSPIKPADLDRFAERRHRVLDHHGRRHAMPRLHRRDPRL